MSFYSFVGTVSAVCINRPEVISLLERHLLLVRQEGEFDTYLWAGAFLPDDELVTIPFADAVELTEAEQNLVKGLGMDQDLGEYLGLIFATRIESNLSTDEDFIDEISENLTWIPTTDLLARLKPNEITVEANMASTGNIFNGMSVGLPGSLEVIERYSIDAESSVGAYNLSSQLKRIEVDCENSRRAYFEGYFQFESLKDLTFPLENLSAISNSSLLQVRDRAPSAGSGRYRIEVYLGSERIMIQFDYRDSESRLRKSKVGTHMFATVIHDDSVLYDGCDAAELASVLNIWCRYACEKRLKNDSSA